MAMLNYQRVNPIKSHKTYGFPMVFLWKSPKIHPFSPKKSYSASPERRGERPAAAPRVQPEAVNLTQNQWSLNLEHPQWIS